MSARAEVQQALNIIRQHSEDATWDAKLEMLQLTMETASGIVTLSRKLTKSKQTTSTKTNYIPQTKAVTRYVDVVGDSDPSKDEAGDTGVDLSAIKPSGPLTAKQLHKRGVQK